MRFLHILNALAWLANTVLWYAYAHSLFFALASAFAVGVSLVLAWKHHPDYWR